MHLICGTSFVALRQGGRWPYFYVATIFHGFTVEFMAYFFPHIDNFWHAQGVFTFIERRMPLYIVFLCMCLRFAASFRRKLQINIVLTLGSCRYGVLLPLILGHVEDEA